MFDAASAGLLDFLPASAGFGLSRLLGVIPASVSVHMYWYLGRSAAFVAYGALFVSVALGIAVSSRVFDGLLGRPWVFEIHRFLSVFVIVVMLFHALIMLPDPYAGFSVKQLLVPFQSHLSKDFAMGIGIVTFYTAAFLSVSFYLTKLIGQKTWRTLHYLSFAVFVAATVHGAWMGTDSKLYAVRLMYLAAGAGVMFLLFYRVLAMRGSRSKTKNPAARRPAAVAAVVVAEGK